MSCTGETEVLEEIVSVIIPFNTIYSTVVHIVAMNYNLKVKSWETSLYCLLLEPFESLDSLIKTSESVYKIYDIIKHEYRLSVDLVIVRLLEIFFNIPFTDLLKFFTVSLASPDDIVLILVIETCVPCVSYVMVGPHKVELHVLAVVSLKEAIVQGCLHERTAIIPVPVENEYIHAILQSLIDFHLHHCRICFVDISPERLALPVMTRKTVLNCHHCFPLTDTHRPERSKTWIVCCISRIKERSNVVFFLLCK